jgi:hypothetical protein
VDHQRPGERASDHREEVQRDRNGDPFPAHGTERAADRGEGVASPPEQAGERREDDEPQEDTQDPAGRHPEKLVGLETHPRHYRRRPVRLRSPHDREIVRLALPALGALAAEPL